MKKYLITGGAGFIGSNLTKTILREEPDAGVIVYDNFSSGRERHLKEVEAHKNLSVIRADVKDKDTLREAMKDVDIVYHFASNPDISAALTRPDIDFWEGTYLTNNVLEAMRVNNVRKILYASGSGVYGDAGETEVNEDYPLKLPVSTYGANKLSGEAMISAYCRMFDMEGVVFRFANVVGPSQTHGVGYDFVKKLLYNPGELTILGNGRQSKSYMYITDVISAMRLLEKDSPGGFSYYNVATLDYIEVKDIADIVVDVMRLKGVKYSYTGGDRGWKGDVPVVRIDSGKIRKMGWGNKFSSREAVRKSIECILKESTRQ